MKFTSYFFALLIVSLITLISIPAQAQVTLGLYDNFKTKLLDPTKWTGRESGGGIRGILLESSRQIKTDPILLSKGLDIQERVYGDPTTDTGLSLGTNELVFIDGTDITTIQATVEVKSLKVIGCAANSDATQAGAVINGLFFNTGTPTSGSSLNDVGALLGIWRLSNSSDPAKVLEVVGHVYQCLDEKCGTYTLLDSESLGTVHLNQTVKLQITWDKTNHQFIFQKGKSTPVPFTYAVSDTNPPGTSNGGAKHLGVRQYVASCDMTKTTPPRPVASMEAFFEKVYVNASAIP